MGEEIIGSDKDYLTILKALQEIPFPVGKNLLADFLIGDGGNNSIDKHQLHELHNFDSIKRERQEVVNIIDDLINKGLINLSGTKSNRFLKVLTITRRGIEELQQPGSVTNKKVEYNFNESEITEEDKAIFNELNGLLDKYNDHQKKAIISDNNSILCIAGAGSGKTSVLTKRVEFLAKFRNISPKKILAITFTRKAKEEMSKRLIELGINVQVETFNSFCEKILRLYYREIYGRPVRIMGYSEKIFLVIQALEKQGLDMEKAIDIYFNESQKRNKTKEQLTNIFINDCFFILEYFKLKEKEIYDFSVNAYDEKQSAKMMFDICQYLVKYMDDLGLRDYTDQVLDALNFMKKNPKVIPEYDHLLIDEYQDVNAKQIELINLLNPENIFAVGDPRQSIFGWRGSDINYIINFKEIYPESEIIVLRKNYRSSNNLVNLMNLAIKEMKLPDLQANKDNNNKIDLIEFDNEEQEAIFISDKIINSQVEREEIFVLARTNRQLQEISRILRRRNISHVLKTDEINKTIEAKKGQVTLATIHAIKGLEAKLVMIAGCNEINFPSKTTDHPVIEMVKMDEYDKDEEEKRLFYVAISRAKEKLIMTYSGKRITPFLTDEMMNIIDN